jgi:hypothetical protein
MNPPAQQRKVPDIWKPATTLWCRVFNPPLEWHVESQSHPQLPHLVNLGGYDGNGECDCENFTFKKLPEVKAGRRPQPATRCKHIRAAREALLNRAIREHIEEEKNLNKTDHE